MWDGILTHPGERVRSRATKRAKYSSGLGDAQPRENNTGAQRSHGGTGLYNALRAISTDTDLREAQ